MSKLAYCATRIDRTLLIMRLNSSREAVGVNTSPG